MSGGVAGRRSGLRRRPSSGRGCGTIAAEITIGLPGAEYFSAFETRLTSIWRRRLSSAWTTSTAAMSTRTERDVSACSAGSPGVPISRGSKVSSTLRTVCASGTGRRVSRGTLASMKPASSTLESSSSTASPDCSARAIMRSRCSSSSWPCIIASSSMLPYIAMIGERSSWLAAMMN